MRSQGLACSARLGAITLMLAAAGISAASPAAASRAESGPTDPVTVSGNLTAVAATSAASAWAVGYKIAPRRTYTLIVHWNGIAWKPVPSPTPAGSSATLDGVAVASATSAWAVGSATYSSGIRTLILHWNGTAWRQVPSPTPAHLGLLHSVAVVSARNAWAVGESYTSTGVTTLILHWNGTAWKQVPSPTPKTSGVVTLRGVAVTSARNAWAVGFVHPPNGAGPRAASTHAALILHWNGTAWKQVPSPNPGGPVNLWGVAATSARNAWAVGWNGKPLILHWNGTAWKQVPSPAAASDGILRDVAALSTRSAWAVGYPLSSKKTLILRWNGTTWKLVPAPMAGLFGVAAPSAARAWAVGGNSILTWNGARWK